MWSSRPILAARFGASSPQSDSTGLTAVLDAQRAPRPTLWLMASIHFGLGITWLLSSPARSRGPAYSALVEAGRDFDPGHPMRFWGVLFLVAGLGIAIASLSVPRTWIPLALGCGFAVLCFYGTVQTIAGMRDNGPLTAPWIWGPLAVWHLLNLVYAARALPSRPLRVRPRG